MSKNRCIVCKKKTITGIHCECGVYLCLSHRYNEYHNCQYRIDILKEQKKKQTDEILMNKTNNKKIEKL